MTRLLSRSHCRRRLGTIVRATLASLLLLAAFRDARAEDAAARQVLDRVKQLNDTTRDWKDLTRRMQIVVKDPRSPERTRDLVMRTRRGDDREDKTVVVFNGPPAVRGTAFLQFDHRDRDAEQWLYLPELRRVRKITSSSKNDSFMGTDFSYRDLELLTDVVEWTEEEASSRVVGTEKIDGQEVTLIERVPVVKDVGYERIVVAFTKDDVVMRRMEFYGEAEAPMKILDLDRIEVIDQIPTARGLRMRQPAEESETTVDVSEVRYNQDLPDRLFTERALQRGLDDAEGSDE